MLLYLRHGDDRGENFYRHDRRLNDRGRKEAGKEARRLIDKLGHPDVVYVSPFRRAKETLACMADHFERAVETHCDRRIAQHLSNKQRKNPSISPQTLELVAIEEDDAAFRRRVADHVREARARAQGPLNIWAITHQVVIEEVAEQFDVKISGDLDFLDHVVMIG